MAKTILAIETSCDETAVCILEGFGDCLADVVHSQIAEHTPYGGVVPEIASRSHLESLPRLVEAALAQAEMELSGVDVFAATTSPGLAPALLVGASAARGMAVGAGKPFYPINHIEGHLLSSFFGEAEIPPHAALIASGGHTLLFVVEGFRKYRLLERTLDDAAGEAFDKVAKLLGLPYPGGVAIEQMARGGDASAIEFPRALLNDLNFSFSGLKTAVRYFIEKDKGAHRIEDVCASFQEAVVDVLIAKLVRAARAGNFSLATISGGVCSNLHLAKKAQAALALHGIELRLPTQELRTDNARMIAYTAAHCVAANIPPGTATIAPQFTGIRGVCKKDI